MIHKFLVKPTQIKQIRLKLFKIQTSTTKYLSHILALE